MPYKNKEDKKAYDRKWYSLHRKDRNKYIRKNQRERMQKRKNRIYEEAGDKCSKCGYDKCRAALEFHHLNSDEKHPYVARMFNNGLSYKKIKAEIEKCILLCANCHREVHVE